jgi:hypothetical protein
MLSVFKHTLHNGERSRTGAFNMTSKSGRYRLRQGDRQCCGPSPTK